jgi:hypothetical protein
MFLGDLLGRGMMAMVAQVRMVETAGNLAVPVVVDQAAARLPGSTRWVAGAGFDGLEFVVGHHVKKPHHVDQGSLPITIRILRCRRSLLSESVQGGVL